MVALSYDDWKVLFTSSASWRSKERCASLIILVGTPVVKKGLNWWGDKYDVRSSKEFNPRTTN
jgi:hypothetical protein